MIINAVNEPAELIVERPTVVLLPSINELGPILWAELHTQCEPSKEWFQGWLAKVPWVGCGCRGKIDEWLKENPAIFGPGWFAFTVRMHNFVNESLGLQGWTIEQAAERWLTDA